MKKFMLLCILIFSFSSDFALARIRSCNLNPGASDSYLLALSSFPGFCETNDYAQRKPECRYLMEDSYQAQHLSLHGLWPVQTGCGRSYGFCGVAPRNRHCAYPALQLSNKVMQQLKQAMPAYQYGSCLERHEWNKHGSCQSLSANDYFALATRLTAEANQSPFGQYVTENQGQTVSLVSIHDMIIKSFGRHSLGRVYLSCKYGVLVDVYLQLPALIPAEESLTSLVARAPNYKYHDSCPAWVKISDFSQ